MISDKFIVEVCAETAASAVVAQEAGARRIEFCDNMAEGGTTPSAGQIRAARAALDIDLFVIIRPRGGDFVYTELEQRIMLDDIRFCGETGCDGVVIGALTQHGDVDMARCRELVAEARKFGMGVTFHRAFDVCRDQKAALEAVIELCCDRILTSGGEATAEEGMDNIRALMEQAGGRIVIMPGSGVTPGNVAEIISGTGCLEVHGTFRSRYPGTAIHSPAWADFELWHTDPEKVKAVVETANRLKF